VRRRFALAASRLRLAWLAAGLAVSAVALVWLGYRAITEWQRSATLLAQRNADAAVDLLVTALTKDMRGVQSSVLASLLFDEATRDPLLDLNAVGSAFARYPYPELFFAARGTPRSVVFYGRAERPPAWLASAIDRTPFPVMFAEDPRTSDVLLTRIGRDVFEGKRFSVFDVRLQDVNYQVVVRLQYADEAHDRLEGILGFMVNLDWVRSHYFQELTEQVGRIRGVANGVRLTISDRTGAVMAGLPVEETDGPFSTREFPLLFFDPGLIELDKPADVKRPLLIARAAVSDDRGLIAARQGARTTLLLVAASALALVGGLVLTVRAAQANARLVTLRSDFVSAVTHELKTPIATIRAISETLASGRSSTAAAAREYALLAVQESKRLTRLIDNLLAYSRMSDVTQAYSFEAVPVSALIRQSLKEFDAQLRTAGFAVTVDVPEASPLVLADTPSMALAIGNLIDNAIRYSADGRQLMLSARAVSSGVRLEVRDAGRGIPDDEIGLVTRKFFRGQASGSGGSGLGLSIAQRIVKDHSGTLSIQSRPGEGTTVGITLPAANVEDEETHSGR
jgi:signal transduction histidine kinase